LNDNYEWFIFGLVIIIGSSLGYNILINNYFRNLSFLTGYIGLLYIISILIGLLTIGIQIQRIILNQRKLLSTNRPIELDLRSLIYDLMMKKKYRNVFFISLFGYAIIFSVVSGIIVYQPTIDFSQEYSVLIPSIKLIYCCGGIGQYPNAALYITEHFGIMLFPLNVILLIAISSLVGINLLLITFAIENRPKNNVKWVLSAGTLTGLFTGCSTCAGLFLSNILPGSLILATIVSYGSQYQQIFLIITLLLLISSPFIILRNIKYLYKNGCIIENSRIFTKR